MSEKEGEKRRKGVRLARMRDRSHRDNVHIAWDAQVVLDGECRVRARDVEVGLDGKPDRRQYAHNGDVQEHKAGMVGWK